jgi:hypothetical protein
MNITLLHSQSENNEITSGLFIPLAILILLISIKNPFKDKNKDFGDENEISMINRYRGYFGFGLLVLLVIIGFIRFIKFYF